jgi:hypothetical protein
MQPISNHRCCEHASLYWLAILGSAIPGSRTSKSRAKAGKSSKQVKTSNKEQSTITFDTVRKIGLALPGVEASTAWGAPALKVLGKLLACVPTHRSAEPDSLMVRVGLDDRAEMLAAAPETYYVTDHYVGYSGVLVRLSRITTDVLRDLLRMAHKFVTSTGSHHSTSRSRRKPVDLAGFRAIRE